MDAAKHVNRKLRNRVRVTVTYSGNREPLCKLLRDEVGGHLSEALDVLSQRDDLSLAEVSPHPRRWHGLGGHGCINQTDVFVAGEAGKKLAEAIDGVHGSALHRLGLLSNFGRCPA